MARTRTAGGGESVIARAARVHGRVSGEGDLRVEGAVEGDVTLQGDLTVAEGARAASNVDARAVTIAGELEGEIRAEASVHIEASGRVRGDVHCDAVTIDDGAEYVGRLHAQFELPDELGGGKRR